MLKLKEPSKAIASKVLDELGFEERFIGYRLNKRTGPVKTTLYSLAEVVGLLFDSHPRLDFKELAKWIHDVYGDEDLVSNMSDIISINVSDHEKTIQIREIIIQRLIQCKKIMDNEKV